MVSVRFAFWVSLESMPGTIEWPSIFSNWKPCRAPLAGQPLLIKSQLSGGKSIGSQGIANDWVGGRCGAHLLLFSHFFRTPENLHGHTGSVKVFSGVFFALPCGRPRRVHGFCELLNGQAFFSNWKPCRAPLAGQPLLIKSQLSGGKSVGTQGIANDWVGGRCGAHSSIFSLFPHTG